MVTFFRGQVLLECLEELQCPGRKDKVKLTRKLKSCLNHLNFGQHSFFVINDYVLYTVSGRIVTSELQ